MGLGLCSCGNISSDFVLPKINFIVPPSFIHKDCLQVSILCTFPNRVLSPGLFLSCLCAGRVGWSPLLLLAWLQ